MPDAKAKQVATKKPGLTKKFFKSFVDVKKWSSYDEVSANTKTTWTMFQRLIYRKPKALRKENYKEAIARLGLTEKQTAARKNNFLYSSFVYAFFAVGFLVYLVYLLVNFRFLAASLTGLLMVVMSLMAYKEHFWYMQMRREKLGCNFNDWLEFIFRRSAK